MTTPSFRFVFVLAAIVVSGLSACNKNTAKEVGPPISRYVEELRRDVKREGIAYNADVACYVDLTRPDNDYRFFVLDLTRKKVLLQGICLNGQTDAQGQVRYSNEVDSNCSSRGLASIGERYTGRFGRCTACMASNPALVTFAGGQ
ncbi:murein L,D-transpeptidase catalytic domain-containing protein [Hymenobacter sp. IS2118]|uniref:murein L,D-transpeptidase catalytic domain-containing protein n=1 Tax=Hymenobacter sp. IS2118 TaxID=1505605 RepID=UPI000554EEFC|nr:murein L,D-transpeptidase catalytic domain family protein [Hymenobacter sp. IS2118]